MALGIQIIPQMLLYLTRECICDRKTWIYSPFRHRGLQTQKIFHHHGYDPDRSNPAVFRDLYDLPSVLMSHWAKYVSPVTTRES